MADGDRTHYVGDSCDGGHRDDPMAASLLNDEILEETERTEEVEVLVSDAGVLTDRQAALFAAVQLHGPGVVLDRCASDVVDAADVFLDWLEEADHQESADG